MPAIVVIFLVLFVGYCTFSGGGSKEKKARGPCYGLHLNANQVAKDAVRKSLKSPSTASFTSAKAWQDKDCTFKFHGYVDAQNGFGAMIRSEYGGSLIMSEDPISGKVTQLIIE